MAGHCGSCFAGTHFGWRAKDNQKDPPPMFRSDGSGVEHLGVFLFVLVPLVLCMLKRKPKERHIFCQIP